MKQKTKSYALLLAALLLASCGVIPSRSGPPSPAAVKPNNEDRAKADTTQTIERPSTMPLIGGVDTFDREKHADDELLVYAKRFGDLSTDNQKKEYSQVVQALAKNKKDIFNRIKAALIYALPNSKLRDNAKAVSLLAELLKEKQIEEDVSAFLAILKDYVDERQKLEDSAVRLSQRIRDEQRRADELQQKLDALKNIDKTMIERGQAAPK